MLTKRRHTRYLVLHCDTALLRETQPRITYASTSTQTSKRVAFCWSTSRWLILTHFITHNGNILPTFCVLECAQVRQQKALNTSTRFLERIWKVCFFAFQLLTCLSPLSDFAHVFLVAIDSISNKSKKNFYRMSNDFPQDLSSVTEQRWGKQTCTYYFRIFLFSQSAITEDSKMSTQTGPVRRSQRNSDLFVITSVRILATLFQQ